MSNDLIVQSIGQQTDELVNQDVANLSAEEQIKWLQEMGQNLELWEAGEDYTKMRQAQILWYADKGWKNLKLEALSEFKQEFYEWVRRYTRKAEDMYDRSTINSYIRVYDRWIANPVLSLPERILIPATDESGNEVLDTSGDIVYKEIEPDIFKVPYSKLQVAAGIARSIANDNIHEGKNDSLPESAWVAIFDPKAKVKHVKEALGLAQHNRPKGMQRYFDMRTDGPVLIISEPGKTMALFYLDTDNADDPFFKRAVAWLEETLGVEFDLMYSGVTGG